ncbi:MULTISPECIES: SDR family oxidoreductase [Shouchella]|uniref:SDR family oxidoreductase n=2 Tax=Shouchella TaxID=2893057 RepID=A0ABY7W831_9BACI|nr:MULTISPECIES: SDR family oxidoreductase [Shouchella]MED4128338.1 SDR family oxidoreductase [Shouchella miscanthi]WDF05029.1 SDR family oxidoreductase [Shouchella hunanensis]
MNVLVIGANGQVGKHLIQQLQESEHTSIAMVRKKEQVETMKELGADDVVIADLEDDFSEAFTQADAVLFAAGSGGSTGADKTLTVDLWGAIKAFRYAEDASIKQFVQLSSIGAGNPDAQPDKIKHYMVAKAVADQVLMSTSLSYSIVRPGVLTNDKPAGTIQAKAEFEQLSDSSISRADVAAVLIESLTNEATHGKAFEIIGGSEQRTDALSTLN